MDLFDLVGKISADTSGVELNLAQVQAKVLALAKEFVTTERAAQKSAAGMAMSMATANAQINKMQLGNVTAEYTRFQNALKLNSIHSRQAADDFLNLFSKVTGHTKVVAEAEQGTHKLAEAFRVLSSSSVVVQGPLGGVSSRLRAVGTDIGALAGLGPLAAGLAAVGIVALADIAVILALDEVAKKTAESFARFGTEIFKAELSTGLSAKTLEQLYVVAKLTGSNFDTLSIAVSRMAVNIDKGVTSKAGEATQALQLLAKNGLDTAKLSAASADERLQLVAAGLLKIQDPADKARVAAALFGRGVFQNAAAIDEWAKSTEEAQKQIEKFGLDLSETEVARAHEFEHAFKAMGLIMEGVGIQAGERTAPMIISALENIGTALGINEASWKDWGIYTGEVLAQVVGATQGAAVMISNALAVAVKQPYAAGKGALVALGTALATGSVETGVATGFAVANEPMTTAMRNYQESMRKIILDYNKAITAPVDIGHALTAGGIKFPPSDGGGRGRGGGRTKKEIDDVAEALRKQSEEITKAWQQTDKYQEEIVKLVDALAKKHKALTDDQRKQLEANAEMLRSIDAFHSWNDFLREQERSISDVRGGVDQYEKAIRSWEDGERKAGRAVEDGTLALMRRNAETQRAIEKTRQRIVLEQTLTDRLERQRVVTMDEIMRRAYSVLPEGERGTRERRVTGPSEDTLNRIRDLSSQITFTLQGAIHVGFERGTKEGILALSQGFLQMGEGIIAKRMEKQIEEMLTHLANAVKGKGGILGKISGAIFGDQNQVPIQLNTTATELNTTAIVALTESIAVSSASSSATGGGLWKTLAGIILGGIGGGAGGSSSGGGIGTQWGGGVGNYASGLDYVPYDRFPAILHKGEAVIPASQNRGGGQPTEIHYHTHQWYITTRDEQSFASRDTESQITRMATRAMQKAAVRR
jgi:hypothetical protein